MIAAHSVVFPIPFRPMTASDSLPMENETSWTAGTLP